MLCTFSFVCFQIYQNKSAKNIAIYFIGTIVPIKCMPKISAVGLFCLDKFENNQTRTCTTIFRTSKLTELYFKPLIMYTVKPCSQNLTIVYDKLYVVKIWRFGQLQCKLESKKNSEHMQKC